MQRPLLIYFFSPVYSAVTNTHDLVHHRIILLDEFHQRSESFQFFQSLVTQYLPPIKKIPYCYIGLLIVSKR